VWGTNGPLELEGVERMSLGAAAVLARHDHDLRLPSLREINPELARLLAQHRRRLYLDGLRSLDAVTAKALAVHGLETVRRSWRESLEAWKAIEEMPSPGDPGWEPEHELELTDAMFLDVGMLEMLTMSLSGLRRLSPSAARQLGQHKGVMIIDGLNQSTTRRPRSWAIIPALCNSTASAASLWPRGPWPAGAASGQSASHSTAAAALSRLGRLNRQITRRLARWLSAARSRGRKRPG